jgi:hypothetical protein
VALALRVSTILLWQYLEFNISYFFDNKKSRIKHRDLISVLDHGALLFYALRLAAKFEFNANF